MLPGGVKVPLLGLAGHCGFCYKSLAKPESTSVRQNVHGRVTHKTL